jgi:uncharacterized protein (TIGR02677 family)
MIPRFSEIVETKYLNTENTDRYRFIVHFMYEKQKNFKMEVLPEEIYEEMMGDPYFIEISYTMDQLHQDLSRLVAYGNLTEQQETGSCRTIEEFKNRKYRYLCTIRTIEIERMIERISQLDLGINGTLEKTLWERVYEALNRVFNHHPDHKELMYSLAHLEDEEIVQRWDDLFDYFRKLTQNTQDYLAHLHSQKAKEMMISESFLIFKDKLTGHLRNFIMASHLAARKIEVLLSHVPAAFERQLIHQMVQHQMNYPRLQETPNYARLEQKYRDQWNNFKGWFLGGRNEKSEFLRLQQETTEAIRRVTKNAQRISETRNNLHHRQNDYLHLARWFDSLPSTEEAHQLSSLVFGVMQPRHLYVTTEKLTDDIYANIWREGAAEIEIKPQTHQYRERSKPSPFRDRATEKEEQRRQFLLEREEEKKMILALMGDGEITLNQLSLINPYVRRTILRWIDRCQGRKDRMAKLDSGHEIQMLLLDALRVKVQCEDGILDSPNWTFRILPGGEVL